MKLNSTFSIQDKKVRDLDNVKDYPTYTDLVSEQNPNASIEYWDKECELNPSNPHCLIYDD
tara:strand:- start:183 stop:365 length:183 start_codon:yes stop_codon:yes gene_type:complete